MTAAIYARKSTVACLLCVLVLAGCGRYYYGKPNATSLDFRTDSTACITEIGIPSPNKQYALVAKEPYRRCMLGKGWTREQRVDDVGWYRGVEDDQRVIDLAQGVEQPGPGTSSGSDAFCRARHLDGRSAWRDNLPAYWECLGR